MCDTSTYPQHDDSDDTVDGLDSEPVVEDVDTCRPAPNTRSQGADAHNDGASTNDDTPSDMTSARMAPTKRKRPRKDPRLTEASNIMKSVVTSDRDEWSAYAEVVCNKLRKMEGTSRIIDQQKINTILYEAEMGMYSTNMTTNQQHRQCSVRTHYHTTIS